MGFLVPAFLAGLAALAIPVLMHLRDRNEERPTRFPSLMFLVRLPIRTSDRRKVTDWPLLLLRALAVAILVLAFSRPFFGRDAAVTADARARSVVLAVDRSMSMGYAGTWDAARDSVRAVLAGFGPDDRVALVLFDEEATLAVPWTGDAATVRAAVDATRPLPRGTGLGAALRVSRGAFTGAPPGAPEIILVTDLQRTGLTGVAGLELPAGLPIRVVRAAPPARPNTHLAGVEARRVLEGERVRLQVQAQVVTRELPAPRRATLTLTLGGRAVATREATLPASGALTVAFDAVAAPTGAFDGVVALDADALPGDDRLGFALPADEAVTVLLVVPDDLARDETLFLERALAIGRAPGVRIERRRPGAIDAAALARAGLIWYWDVAPPAGGAAAATEAWIRAGGGMAVLVGPRLAGRRGVALAGAGSVAGLAERRTGGGGVIGEVRMEHPLFAPFRAAPAAIGAPRFTRYARVEPAVGTDVLARFDDGSPAVLERPLDEGRILVLTTGLDVREGDFPLQPAFLPFLRRVVLHGSGHAATPLWRATGESWLPRGVRREPVVAAPDGTLLRPEAGEGAPAVILVQVGVYAAYEGRVDGAPRALVAVNPPTRESDLTGADDAELLLGVGTVADSTIGGITAPTAIEVESRQRAWRLLVLLALALLVGESLLASRGWRGKARRASVVSTGEGPA